MCFSGNTALQQRHRVLVFVSNRRRHDDKSVYDNYQHDHGRADDDDNDGSDHNNRDNDDDPGANRVCSQF